MAQTTDGMSARAQKVEYSTDDGASWTDISGYAVSVTPAGGDRAHSDAYTFDGDTPIKGYGKLSPAEAQISAVYTQADAEPFDKIYDAKVDNSDFWLKWSYAGGSVGDKEYQVRGKVVACTPPSGNADSPDIIMFQATVVSSGFTESTASS
jgi:hypothetical protein